MFVGTQEHSKQVLLNQQIKKYPNKWNVIHLVNSFYSQSLVVNFQHMFVINSMLLNVLLGQV